MNYILLDKNHLENKIIPFVSNPVTVHENFINIVTDPVRLFQIYTLVISMLTSILLYRYYISCVAVKEKKNYIPVVEDISSHTFKKIIDQIGDDKESWPVMLVNEVQNLRKEIAELKANTRE
jgi:hypothetical protein